MLPYPVAVIMGYSIAIAAAIGLIRYKKVSSAYLPFFFFIWFDIINHTLSVILNEVIHTNAINSNIAVLIEGLLFLWLFRNWGLFHLNKWLFSTLIIVLITIWIIDNIIWHDLTSFNSLFRIVNSFMLIFLSIEELNKLIVHERKNLLCNARFAICIGLIIYCSYKATTEIFFLINLKASNTFYIKIFVILVFINCIVNLIYAWAALWIPKKQKFTLLP